MCAHKHAYCSPVLWLSQGFQVGLCLIVPQLQLKLAFDDIGHCAQVLEIILAELFSASDDFEQPLTGWRNTVNKTSLHPPSSPAPVSPRPGRKLHLFIFQKYEIVILCLRFLKLGEDANRSRGKAVWRKKIRRPAINQSIVKM